METQFQHALENQQRVWDKLALGREKWHDFMMAFLKPMGDEIIQALRLKQDDSVLDLATGTGEPGLTIAAIVNEGKVIGADLSPDMLRIAQWKALEKGIINYQTIVCDAGHLPFEDNSFDAVSCRNGYMFFPDLTAATWELYRIVKPGRRIAVSVWGTADKNAWATVPMTIIRSNVDNSVAPSSEISLFRCARTNFIANLFKETGLQNISVNTFTGKVSFPSKEVYWEFITEVTAPVALAISQVDAATQEKIKLELFKFIQDVSLTGNPVFDYETLIIAGEK